MTGAWINRALHQSEQEMSAINLDEKFSQFDEHWAPKIIARLNDLHVKAVKLQGAFVWHAHADTDEMFMVHKGELTIQLRDGEVLLRAGELCVVPRGVEHRPVADGECEVLLIEPAGTVNTGDAGGERTAPSGEWI
jgi:mannose-6-phosphate isomerase-like protein (cupin superfamily)